MRTVLGMPGMGRLAGMAAVACMVTVAGGAERTLRVRSVYWEPYLPDPDTSVLLHFEGESLGDGGGSLGLEAKPGAVSLGSSSEEPQGNRLYNDIGGRSATPEPALVGACRRVAGGRFGGGLHLAAGGAVKGPSPSDLLAVELWVRPKRLPGKAVPLLRIRGRRGATLALQMNTRGALRLQLGTETLARALPGLRADSWRHVAIVLEESVLAPAGKGRNGRLPRKRAVLCVNGRRRGTGVSAKLDVFKGKRLRVGGPADAESGFNGRIDELRVSRSSRDFAERQRHWERAGIGEGRPYFRDVSDLVLHAPLDGGMEPARAPSGTQVLRKGLNATKAKAQFVYGAGVAGRALRLGPRSGEAAGYRATDMIHRDRGTIAFWLMPLNWSSRSGPLKPEEKGEKQFVPLLRLRKQEKKLLELSAVVRPGRAPTLRAGRWRHVAITWRPAGTRIYMDGAPLSDPGLWRWRKHHWERDEGQPREAVQKRLIFPVGKRSSLVDDFRVYRRPLSPGELRNVIARYDARRDTRKLPSVGINVRPTKRGTAARAVVTPFTGDYERGQRCRVRVRRPGQEQVLFATTARLDASGSAVVPVDLPAHDYGRFRVAARVTDGSGRALGKAQVRYDRPVPTWWDYDASFYPSYDKVRVRLAGRELAEPVRSASARLRLFRDGERIWSGELTLKKGRGRGVFSVPPMKEGKYRLELQPKGAATPMREPYTRKVYPWEKKKLGVTKKVYPPFKPIEVDGRSLDVVLRRHQVGPLGFWKSVEAKGQDADSPWRQMLAEPITLQANGKRLEGTGSFTKKANHKVVYKGRAVHPAVRVRTRCTTTYDGCMRVALNLLPGDAPSNKAAKLKTLVLEIPLRDERVSLWHVAGSRAMMRDNPVGRVPSGQGAFWDTAKQYEKPYKGGKFTTIETGWDRRRLRKQFFGTFVPYIWLGDHARGIAWFADNDKGWVTDPRGEDAAVSLHRRNGVLRLRVHLVQAPIRLQEPRTIVFGLMASPAKPMRPNWRKWFPHPFREDLTTWGFQMGQYTGQSATACRYPLHKDYELIEKMRARRLGESIEGYVDRTWAPKHLTADMPKAVRRHHLGMVRHAAGLPAEPDRFLAYYEEFVVSIHHEENITFGYEWHGSPFRGNYIRDFAGRPPKTPKQAMKPGITGESAPSYIDFATWHGKKLLERGQGLYFDNTMPGHSRDTVVSSAYEHPRRDGVQPSALLWWHRSYFKRIWTLEQEVAPTKAKPMLMAHMTNANIIPYIAYMDASLDLEWWGDGPVVMQKRYPPDLLRAETTGLHTGNVPAALMNLGDEENLGENEAKVAKRTRFGTMAVHEVRQAYGGGSKIVRSLWKKLYDFGYGKENCAVYNYWDHDDPVRAEPEAVKTLLLRRGQRMLLVLCSWRPEPVSCELIVDVDALGLRGTRAYDAEHPEPPDRKQREAEKLKSLMKGADGQGDLALKEPAKKQEMTRWRKNNIAGAFEYQGRIRGEPSKGRITVPLSAFGVRVVVLE